MHSTDLTLGSQGEQGCSMLRACRYRGSPQDSPPQAPLSDWEVEVLLDECLSHAREADYHFRRMVRFARAMSGRSWEYAEAQSFVGSCGIVSKILWGSRRVPLRGQLLKALRIDASSPRGQGLVSAAKNRDLRNLLEHVDVYLESNIRRRNGTFFADRNVSSSSGDAVGAFRHFDPVTLEYWAQGRRFDLTRIRRAVEEIRRRIGLFFADHPDHHVAAAEFDGVRKLEFIEAWIVQRALSRASYARADEDAARSMRQSAADFLGYAIPLRNPIEARRIREERELTVRRAALRHHLASIGWSEEEIADLERDDEERRRRQ